MESPVFTGMVRLKSLGFKPATGSPFRHWAASVDAWQVSPSRHRGDMVSFQHSGARALMALRTLLFCVVFS